MLNFIENCVLSLFNMLLLYKETYRKLCLIIVEHVTTNKETLENCIIVEHVKL